ncbi:hypothetical protein BRD00_14955 [Halobacteriales archaeon QS_8_69_26]|nr:MAG: hypothetical protein BRD00_14955 [Halobacteriales archaeon QS_8_69_26]
MCDRRPGGRTDPSDDTRPDDRNIGPEERTALEGACRTDTSDASTETGPDELHDALANARRRRLLSYLMARSDEAIPFDEVVDAVCGREWPGDGAATHRERVAVDLHHVHLPMLADLGVVTLDPAAETVEYERCPPLETLLAASGGVEEATGSDPER